MGASVRQAVTGPCQLAQYNLEADTGKFFKVTGSAPAKVEFKPGLLRTQNPYYFEGETLVANIEHLRHGEPPEGP